MEKEREREGERKRAKVLIKKAESLQNELFTVGKVFFESHISTKKNLFIKLQSTLFNAKSLTRAITRLPRLGLKLMTVKR